MLGLAKGLKYTLKNLTRDKLTYDYPNEPLPLPDRFRGIQKFYPEKCIVCNQCATICPTDCIQLTWKNTRIQRKKGKSLTHMTSILKFAFCVIYAPRFAQPRQLS